MPGLGASFGRGAATTYQQDLANSDCILVMGSNMAEAHPVGFRWPMRAKEKGATLMHVDPRFTRTSALCDVHVGIRSGSDIAFLGGLINYVLTNERWFEEYVRAYTNASSIIQEGFADTEDLDGLFSGFDAGKRVYNAKDGHWGYEGTPSEGAGGEKGSPKEEPGVHGYSLMGGGPAHSSPRAETSDSAPPRDPTLKHPRCVMQILRRHFGRYTPEAVSSVCGCTAAEMIRVAETLCANSGRERTSAIVYAVGWTQHTTGVQIIRAAGILQLLLGNMGRPGGGIMAMRGHASIQGSTDVPTLFDLLPGYLPQPAATERHDTLDNYVKHEGLPTGYWANFRKFAVSLLKAYYGDAADASNDFRFGWLPRIERNYSHMLTFDRMARGELKGYFLFGQNPGGGGPNAKLHRAGLRSLEWLVVLDWFETESALFWKNDPTGLPPSAIGTEVFFLPAAAGPEKDGTLTNTQRLLQWHDKAIDPPGDCRSDAWYVYDLGKRLKRLYAGSTDPRDAPLLALTWDYDFDEPQRLADGSVSRLEGDPDMAKVLRELNGHDLSAGTPRLLGGFSELKDDGSTACGCWIYSGVYPEAGRNRARERAIGDNPLQPGWGFAWPQNRRVMYNRASADPAGRPWSERKKLIWWDAGEKRWVGLDTPDFDPKKPPDYVPPPGAVGMAALPGTAPFIMKPDGLGWLFSAGSVKDGPLPTHYEPIESPVGNSLYPNQACNPAAVLSESAMNPVAKVPTPEYPVVATTFRLTEHYLSGPMSRFNSWLNELQPEMFVELGEELAAERGIAHGGWATVRTPRGSIDVRAMVTRRLRPLLIDGRVVHQIGLPIHWGFAGECVGAGVNDLTSLVSEPNVSIHEAKAFACQVAAGPPAGPTLRPTVSAAPQPAGPTPETPASARPEGRFGHDA